MGYQGQSSTKLWVSTFIPACTSYRATETRGKLSENLSLPFLTVRRASLALARTRGCQFFRPWCPTMLRTVSTFFDNLSSARPDLLAVLKVLVLELATAGHHSRDNITSLVTQIATHHAYSCQPSFHDTDENKIASELVTIVRAGHATQSIIEETESQMEPMVSSPSFSLDIVQDDTTGNVHDYNNPQNVLYEEPNLHSLAFQIYANDIIESYISSDHSHRKKTLSCVLK